MFWLITPVLVATNMAGDVPTSHQKHPVFVTTNVVSHVVLKRTLALQSPACQCLRHYPLHLQTLESGHKYVIGT